MRRLALLAIAAVVAAAAVAGSAATLGVTTRKVDSFTAAKPAVPPATPSSCGTATPSPMGASPTRFYVSALVSGEQRMYSYDHDGSGVFSGAQFRALPAANGNSSGMSATASWAYVLDATDKQVYRYPLTYPSSGTSAVTVASSRVLGLSTANAGGLAVDEVNNEIWVAEHDTTINPRRTWARCFKLDEAFNGAIGSLTAFRTFEINTNATQNTDAQVSRGLGMDATYLYLMTDTKRLYRMARTSTAGNGDIERGNTSNSDTPRGGEIRGNVLYLAGNGSRIYRFTNVNAFFSGSSVIDASPVTPLPLAHSGMTGM